MELIIDGRVITDKDMKFLDFGGEGQVYHFEDKAIKIYVSVSLKQRLSFEDVSKMTTIHTEFVMLPRGLVHNDNLKPKGYYTIYRNKLPVGSILEISTAEFADDLDEVYGDLKILADYSITVDDLCLDNFVYDGHFRFVDPGSYMFESIPPEVAYLVNKERFTEFVIGDLFRRTIPLKKRDVELLRRHFLSDSNIADLIRYEGRCDETVKEFVKRITSWVILFFGLL